MSSPGQNQFVKHVLNPVSGIRSKLFPALQKLTLFGVPLECGIEDIVSAFTMSQLQFLKLQDCLDTNQMLRFLASFPHSLRLTSFELNFTGHFIEQYDITPLKEFLLSFQGLEDLFILYPREWDPQTEYWSAVSHHKSTLRRVVNQQEGLTGRPAAVNPPDRSIEILRELEKTQYSATTCLPIRLVSITTSSCLSNSWVDLGGCTHSLHYWHASNADLNSPSFTFAQQDG
jgi:hypothetical protein